MTMIDINEESNWMISEIEKEKLFLGCRDAAESEEVIEQYQIKSILSIVAFQVHVPNCVKEKKWIVLDDLSSENIKQYFFDCFDFIENCSKPVLVHCEMGMSRSATIVIAYLMSQGKSLKGAYEFVQNKRRFISPNNGFMYQLYKYSEEIDSNSEERIEFIYNKYGRKKGISTKEKEDEIERERMKTFVENFSESEFSWGVYWDKFLTETN